MNKILVVTLSIFVLTALFVTANAVWENKGNGIYEKWVLSDRVDISELQKEVLSLEKTLNDLKNNKEGHIDSCVEGIRNMCNNEYENELIQVEVDLLELKDKLNELK